jgi:hypothetical protein
MLTIIMIAKKIETPSTHPQAGPFEIMPNTRVKKPAMAKLNRILSSRAYLMLSVRGGSMGRGLVFFPKLYRG